MKCASLWILKFLACRDNLQSVGEGLVELGDLGRHAEVDGAVTDLDDKSTDELGVNLFCCWLLVFDWVGVGGRKGVEEGRDVPW